MVPETVQGDGVRMYGEAEDIRREIKHIAERLNELRKFQPATPIGGEVFANATLAYRHLEDASMRLGKAMQALDGGVSVYDKSQVPSN